MYAFAKTGSFHSFHSKSVSYHQRTIYIFRETALGGIHILHNRKKTILLTGIVTVLLTCLPLLVLYFIQYFRYRELSGTLAAYEAEAQAFSDTTVYILSKSVSAGEQITKDKLTACTLKLPTTSNPVLVTDSSEFVGSYAKTALKKGCFLTPDMLYSDASLSEKTRTLELTDIKLPKHLTHTDLIEIRISFPNGEDFVVLNQQTLLNVLSNEEETYGIRISVSEDELLRLSSALVDQNLYDGAYLYAVTYRADFETASQTDYPVNSDVFSLMQWDPNIVSLFTVPEELEKRTLLEEHLQNFLQPKESDEIELEEIYNIPQT